MFEDVKKRAARFNMNIELLLDFIVQDYELWRGDQPMRDGEIDLIRRNMIEQFKTELDIIEGNKYLKIVRRGMGVWGFVVLADDDKKFKRGDILKAANWKTPARNFARGNVIQKLFGGVRWTGA